MRRPSPLTIGSKNLLRSIPSLLGNGCSKHTATRRKEFDLVLLEDIPDGLNFEIVEIASKEGSRFRRSLLGIGNDTRQYKSVIAIQFSLLLQTNHSMNYLRG